MTKKKISIIAPHPDDEVLGCGGTIYKLVKSGAEVFVAILTNASKTDPVKYTDEKLLNVRNEAKNACGFFIILPESWTRGLVKKSLNLTKRYDQTNPTQIHA